ncbi:MAG: radical SAM family heme chaperone HemW [Gemmatimonadota bacterium]|nr:radical SAM family heme chaperone HemW [Gemmatimonadota bacterium]
MSANPRHLYVHVPFCARRCSYCDFSIAVRQHVPIDEYLNALRAELAVCDRAKDEWRLDTLYFGGGTPSRLGAAGVSRALDLVRQHATLEGDCEVTLEANPEDITVEAARRWHDSGINRLSIGSQSFDSRALEWMHRTHGSAQIEDAVAAARAAGIDNLSLDLIFALPEALGRNWKDDLERVIHLAPRHVSLYGLTIEPHTPAGRWRDRGTLREAPEERYESDFLTAHAALTAAGYEHYEVSNYAQPGFRSRHNSAYWQRVPYAGVGPSAHSFDGMARSWNVAPYADWHRRLAAGADVKAGSETLTLEERAAELVYLGLRISEGLPADSAIVDRSSSWVKAGWAVVANGRIRLTPLGWLRLDTFAADLTLVPSP